MITYRPLTTSDAEDFRTVALSAWIHAYKDIYSLDYIKDYINQNYSNEMVIHALEWSNEHTGFNYVAEDNKEIVGFITIGPVDDSWQLFRIYLLPEYIGKGIGSQLLQLGEDHIQSQKGTTYHLSVHKDNELGKNFYFKKGFKHISEKDEDDEWYLEKKL